MNRRIVNVAFGGNHGKGQHRLRNSLPDGYYLAGWNHIPEGCPGHAEVPYAFKVYAISHEADHIRPYAIHGTIEDLEFCSRLWMDSSCWFIGDPSHYWDLLERDGHILMQDGWKNRQWISEEAADFIEATEAELEAPQIYAIFMGFDFRRDKTREFLRQWKMYADAKVPFAGTSDPAKIKTMWRNDAGQCGPNPPILGHRHDQAVASILAHRLGMNLITQAEARFSTKQPDETVESMQARGILVAAAGM